MSTTHFRLDDFQPEPCCAPLPEQAVWRLCESPSGAGLGRLKPIVPSDNGSWAKLIMSKAKVIDTFRKHFHLVQALFGAYKPPVWLCVAVRLMGGTGGQKDFCRNQLKPLCA